MAEYFTEEALPKEYTTTAAIDITDTGRLSKALMPDGIFQRQIIDRAVAAMVEQGEDPALVAEVLDIKTNIKV